MKTITTLFTLLFFLLAGCGSDPVEGDLPGTSSGASSSESTGCIVGEEGCPCSPDGECFGELLCLSDLCVEQPDSLPTGGETLATTGPKPDVGDGTGSGSTGGTPGCLSNDECGSDEACVSGYCYDTDALFFTTYVEYFSPMSCGDGYGGAELYFSAYEDAEWMLTSSNSVCPGEWPSEADSWSYDSLRTFRLEFWEDDVFEDDYITGLCWQDDADECTPVPKHWLHEGGFQGMVGDHGVSLRFVPEAF